MSKSFLIGLAGIGVAIIATLVISAFAEPTNAHTITPSIDATEVSF